MAEHSEATFAVPRLGMQRRVVYRDETYTEMWVPSEGQAKAFVKQLIRDGKPFKAEPCSDEGWSITVYEFNHSNRWEAE